MKLLGVITEVTERGMQISLPNGLKGTVTRAEASEPFAGKGANRRGGDGDDDEISASDASSSDSDSDSDDDDDGAALRAELEKIRAERDAERRREEDEAAAAKAAAATNPLLDPAPPGERNHGAFGLTVDSHAGAVRRCQEALERRRRLPPPGARRAGEEGQDLRQRHDPQRLPQALPREVHPVAGAWPVLAATHQGFPNSIDTISH